MASLAAASSIQPASFATETGAKYTNPVSKAFTDAFADPSIVRAKDGYWYAYSTGDPTLHRRGDYSFHKMAIARSRDMVDWEYAGDVFGPSNTPDWAPTDNTYYWCPDIRYQGGEYYVYYNTATFGPEFYTAIGVATAPTQDGDLTPNDDTASLLLRDAPEGDYTVETKANIPLRPEAMKGHQRAGLVAYLGDDLNAQLTPALFEPLYVPPTLTRLVQTLFFKEQGGGIGWMPAGPPNDTVRLRLSHGVDPENGEHEFRAATSRDGENWKEAGTWTLPPGAEPRIGLLSVGGTGMTAEFDYFRVYRP